MEEGITVLLVFIGLPAGALAIIALVKAFGVGGRQQRLTREVEELRHNVWLLSKKIERAEPCAPVETPAAVAAKLPPVAEAALVIEAVEPVTPIPPEAMPAEPVPSPAPQPSKAPSARTGEERIGFWLPRIAVVLLVVGLALFFKYLADNDWIGPWGRVAIGMIAGLVALGAGEGLSRWRRQVHAAFVQSLLALGIGLLLVSAYATFGFYHLVAAETAFALFAALAVLGGVLATVHRSEALLILVMLAAFSNPVLLSTGVDRPFALFSYLLIATAGTWAASAVRKFHVAPWLAVAGVMVLYVGWYVRFFDVSPGTPDGAGAYLELVARWPALVFAGLFPMSWIASTAVFRRRGFGFVETSALAIVAAVSAHGAFTALLYDEPVVLAWALLGLSAATVILFVRVGLIAWLLLPLAIGFLVLSCLSGEVDDEILAPMLALAGGLGALHLGTSLWRLHGASGTKASIGPLCGIGGVATGLALVLTLWLVDSHPHMYAVGVVALAAVLIAVGLRFRAALMSTIAAFASFASLLLVVAVRGEPDETLLILCAVWAAIVFCAASVELLVRRSSAIGRHLLALFLAGFGFAGLAFLTTPKDADWLRAALALTAGALYLAFGIAARRKRREIGPASLLPLGLAVTSFSLAVALLCSGATITVVWAVGAVVILYLSMLTRETGWLWGGLAFLAAASLRAVVFDWGWLGHQEQLFLATGGAQGALVPTPFLHHRALALIALGLGALLGACFARRGGEKGPFKGAALALTIFGHGALLALFIGEARIWITRYPDLPAVGLPAEELRAFFEKFRETVAADATRRAMIVTVMLGVYAAVAIGIGFGLRSRLHRFLGIGLFGATLGKLALYDIWSLERLYKIVVLVASGLLLLGGGYLYARFSSRIKELFKGDGPRGLLLLIIAGSALHAATAGAVDPAEYRRAARIEAIDRAGYYRLPVTPELYGATDASVPFGDLRIEGPGGEEAPYFVRRPACPQEIDDVTRRVTLLDPVRLADGTVRAVLDVGPLGVRHDRVSLALDGARTYLRRTRVETSDDGVTYGVLAEGAYVYSVPGETGGSNRIDYPTTAARFLRVSLLPGEEDGEMSIVGAAVRSAPSAPPARCWDALPLPIAGEPCGEAREKESCALVGPLPRGVPLYAIVLRPAAGSFARRVHVEGSGKRVAWFYVGDGFVYRSAPTGGAGRVEEALEVRAFHFSGARFLRVWIADGDDAPLAFEGIEGRFIPSEIVFSAKRAGAYTLLIGRPVDTAPRYDLEAILSRSGDVSIAEAKLGGISSNPAFASQKTEARPESWSDRHQGALRIGIWILAGLLAAWAIALLVRSRRKHL